MELSGEEKRIQALFHEMKLEDSGFTPSFARIWNTAQAGFDLAELRLARPQNPLTLLRLITAVFVISFVLTAVALWARHSQINEPSKDPVAGQLPSNPVVAPERSAARENVASSSGGTRLNRRTSKAGVRRLVNANTRVLTTTARAAHGSALSNWQSPTAALLRLPGDELLRNLPELNQSTEELQRFLSNLN